MICVGKKAPHPDLWRRMTESASSYSPPLPPGCVAEASKNAAVLPLAKRPPGSGWLIDRAASAAGSGAA
jgi:hypothetical protein